MSAFDPAAFLANFRREAAARGFSCETIHQTPCGPLLAFTGPGHGEPAYLSAGIHGDEPAGPLAALELLKSGTFDDGRAWMLCPAVNPTGLAAGTRDNAAGFDLNRDYFRRRTPEVRAHAAWLERQSVPRRFLSLHEDWETSGFYFYEINLGSDRPDRARAILDAARPWFVPEPSARIDDHDVREAGWIYHEARPDFPDHWPEAIFLADRGCPISFTFETPSSAPLAERIQAHFAATHAALRT